MHRPARIIHHGEERAFHGRGARRYDLVARRLMRGVYRRIADDAARTAPEGAAVLDVGTGPGQLLVELADRRPDLRLTGIDVSPDMVAAAERNLRRFGERATARAADVTDLPFPDGSFDLIVSSLSLHHWPDPEGAVPQFARVLRPDGRLCVYDLRSAPFAALEAAAAAGALFTGGRPRRDLIRVHPLFPRLVRYEMRSAPQ